MPYFAITILAFFSLSCSYTVIHDPKDLPTPTEQKMVVSVLEDIQARFNNIGMDLDLKKIPIFVVDEPSSQGIKFAGLCRGEGQRILLDRGLFDEDRFEQGKISLLWWAVLHELGHCYFLRDHVEYVEYADEANIFIFQSENDETDEIWGVCKVESTVMHPAVTEYTGLIPEEAKDYYIQEMAAHHSPEQEFTKKSLKDLDFYVELSVLLENGYELSGECSSHSIDL